MAKKPTYEELEQRVMGSFYFVSNCITQEIFTNLDEKYEHIFAQLITMERKADSFCKAH